MAYKLRRKNQVAGQYTDEVSQLTFGFRLPKGSEEQDSKLAAVNYWAAIAAARRLFLQVAKALDAEEATTEELQAKIDEVQAELMNGKREDLDPELVKYLEETETIEIPGREIEYMAKFLGSLTLKVEGLTGMDDEELTWEDLSEKEHQDLFEELGFEFLRDYHAQVMQVKALTRLGIELP